MIPFLKNIFIPIFLWVIFTPFSPWLDLKMSQYFFEHGSFSSNPVWIGLFRYGFVPAWIMTGCALAAFILSFSNRFREWRKPSLYLLLTFAIGSGLVIHAGLKEYWGRPRPKQTTEFGGNQQFRPYYEPYFGKLPDRYRSFASGHSSVGFVFFSLACLGTVYRSRSLYWAGMGLAFTLGILLSLARIAQGGHFLSDTLASALIMWLTAWGLAYLFFKTRLTSAKGFE